MADKIVVRVDIEEEDTHYVGNCSAIDPKTDSDAEAWISTQLARGNQAAWCIVIVTATCGPFQARDVLGGCSYESVEKLKEDLLPQMEPEVLKRLRSTMRDAIKTAREAERLLPLLTRKTLPIEYE